MTKIKANQYLQNMTAMYNDGAYLETNFGLMAQQAELTEAELLMYFIEKGIKFMYKPTWFRIQKRWAYSKDGSMIVLFKRINDCKALAEKVVDHTPGNDGGVIDLMPSKHDE